LKKTKMMMGLAGFKKEWKPKNTQSQSKRRKVKDIFTKKKEIMNV